MSNQITKTVWEEWAREREVIISSLALNHLLGLKPFTSALPTGSHPLTRKEAVKIIRVPQVCESRPQHTAPRCPSPTSAGLREPLSSLASPSCYSCLHLSSSQKISRCQSRAPGFSDSLPSLILTPKFSLQPGSSASGLICCP